MVVEENTNRSVTKEIYSIKLELLANATVIDDAIPFVFIFLHNPSQSL